VRVLAVGGPTPDLTDPGDRLARHLRLDPAAQAGTACLLRPDAYLAATLPAASPQAVQAAVGTALGRA